MSATLCFRKGGIEILSIGTGHPLAMAFVNKPHEKWAKMKENEFDFVLEVIQNSIDCLKNELSVCERVLGGIADWEERFELAKQMNDIELEIEQVKSTVPMVKLLQMIWEEGMYTDNESNMGLEWGVF